MIFNGELERNAAWLVVPVTLKTALSAPRLGKHELVPIFGCNNSIAILHSDWFHGASDFSHYRCHEHYLEHWPLLPVIHLLVVRTSRKQMAMHHSLMGTIDRRGYGGQQKGTIFDAPGSYPSIWRTLKLFFRRIRLIRCTSHLDAYISRYRDFCANDNDNDNDDTTNYFIPCACVQGNYDGKELINLANFRGKDIRYCKYCNIIVLLQQRLAV